MAHPHMWPPERRWIEHWYGAKPSAALFPPTILGEAENDWTKTISKENKSNLFAQFRNCLIFNFC